MTLHVYLGGVEVDESRVLLPMDAGLTENADGTAARAGLVFDDPAGDFDLTAWTELVVEEDDCDVLRLFTGFVISRAVSRGPYRDGAARMWDCDVIDLNEWLHFTVLQGNRDDAMRPRETGSDRIAWLMGTLGMDGVVFDNGEVANNAWIYDETDYRGQYADDVLRDIISASGVGRWTVFLYWDESAASGEELSLFYNDVSAAVRTSDIRISNLISDQDADTFYPIVDASLERDPSDQYGGVYAVLPVGRIYRTNPTTVAAMGLPNPRDAVYESARINNAETGNRHAVTFLDWHAQEVDTINVTIELPSTRVNHVKAGDRLEVKFTHLPGWSTGFTWTRVQSRTILSLSADRTTYLVRLVLSLKGVLQSGGGGDPGGFPLPPTTCEDGTAEVVQSQSGIPNAVSEILTLPSSPTVGNTVIVYMTRRLTIGAPDVPAGFTDAGIGILGDTVLPHEHTGRVAYRIVQEGDSATLDWSGLSAPDLAFAEERAGQLTPVATSLISVDPYNASSPFPGAAITPTAGRLGAIVGYIFMKRNHGALAADTGWTLLEAATTDSVITHAVVEKVVSSTSGTYTPSFTGANPAAYDNHGYGAITLALLCDASGADNPPAPGQWVFQETVTMAGDTGTTLFPYAPGSLHVYVDGIPISSASYTETDPSAGEFTLSWTPDADEVVRVDYQGL